MRCPLKRKQTSGRRIILASKLMMTSTFSLIVVLVYDQMVP